MSNQVQRDWKGLERLFSFSIIKPMPGCSCRWDKGAREKTLSLLHPGGWLQRVCGRRSTEVKIWYCSNDWWKDGTLSFCVWVNQSCDLELRKKFSTSQESNASFFPLSPLNKAQSTFKTCVGVSHDSSLLSRVGRKRHFQGVLHLA